MEWLKVVYLSHNFLFLGFYGRPWTFDQRRHLYKRLKKLGMNTYLYAPKDDLKHRAEWRILYTPEEAGNYF